jgi:hypothetical protein
MIHILKLRNKLRLHWTFYYYHFAFFVDVLAFSVKPRPVTLSGEICKQKRISPFRCCEQFLTVLIAVNENRTILKLPLGHTAWPRWT